MITHRLFFIISIAAFVLPSCEEDIAMMRQTVTDPIVGKWDFKDTFITVRNRQITTKQPKDSLFVMTFQVDGSFSTPMYRNYPSGYYDKQGRSLTLTYRLKPQPAATSNDSLPPQPETVTEQYTYALDGQTLKLYHKDCPYHCGKTFERK